MSSTDPSPSSAPPAPLEPSTDPAKTGYTPGEDSTTRWRNFFSLLAGNMTPEGKAQYKRDRDIRHEDADCRRCEKHRDFLLKYSMTTPPAQACAQCYARGVSGFLLVVILHCNELIAFIGPIIRFMRDNIKNLGGDINENNIHCRRCTVRSSGGFDPHFGIRLCANEMRNRGHVEDTMAHEMVHAWDHLRFKVDWQNNLRHVACSEIRASSLSGECRFLREFHTRGQWKVTQQHQECVRRRAALSVMARPGCEGEEHAKKVVNEVWESCFVDTRPFDEIYR